MIENIPKDLKELVQQVCVLIDDKLELLLDGGNSKARRFTEFFHPYSFPCAYLDISVREPIQT